MSAFDNGGILGVPGLYRGIYGIQRQFISKKLNIWALPTLSLSPSFGGVSELQGGQSIIFSSYGEYIVQCYSPTTATIKMWGAGGACGYSYTQGIGSTTNQGPGGGGGYVSGIIALQTGNTYIFRIGQGGIRTTSGSTGATYLAGGLVASGTYGGAQGGGYSGIFLSSVSQANTLLLAAGGGGGSDSSFSSYGGAGGGTSGGYGTAGTQGGGSGTQTGGGAAAVYNGATSGAALIGGMSISAGNGAGLGGGGGGYFGGGGGNVGGGGGGSSYFKPSSPVSSGSTTGGSSSTPGNSADSDRGGAGQGGVSGTTSGASGRILLTIS